MTRSPTLAAIALAALLALPAPASALLILTGDGSGNTTPPPEDPGWARFGTKDPCPPHCGLTYVYLGNGWVLTARHVTAQNVRFFASGQVHAPVQGSEVIVGGPNGGIDLMLFRIESPPDLPRLPIRRTRPEPGTPVLMIGAGQTRGPAIPGQPGKGPQGFQAKLPSALRWGTNRIVDAKLNGLPPSLARTRYISVMFEPPGHPHATAHEAQAVEGDSGGAFFVKREGGVWELAGIMLAASPATWGGLTIAADLSHYREEILDIVD